MLKYDVSVFALHGRHNERDGVSNNRLDRLLNRFFFSGADQRKRQSSASLVDSHHIGPVTREVFPFDDVFMEKNNTLGG